MIDLVNKICNRHPELTMVFDEVENKYFCEKCANSEGSVKREIALPKGSISTITTSSTNDLSALELRKKNDELAEQSARVRAEEQKFLELKRLRDEADTKEAAAEAPEHVAGDGLHTGIIKVIENGWAGQQAGRDPAVLIWHQVSKLTGPELKIDESAEITWAKGGGVVKVKDLGKGTEVGG